MKKNPTAKGWLLSVVFLSFFQYSTHAQFGQSWVSFWDGKGHYSDRTEGVVTDSQGNTYVLGSTESSYTNKDILLIKYSLSGQKIWETTWNGPNNDEDLGTNIRLNNAGEIIVVGTTDDYYNNFNKDVVILKYSTSGDLIWESVYQGDNDHDNPKDLEIDNLDNIYVTGDSEEGPSGNRDYMTLKYNTAGALVWDRFYNGTLNSFDYAHGIAVSSTGEVYVTGDSRESGGSTIDFTTVKYSSNGTQEWVNNYNGLDNNWDHGKDVVVDEFDHVYATGYSKAGGSNNTTTIKYDTQTGTIIWDDVQLSASSDAGLQIEYCAVDNSLVIGGYQSGQFGDFSVLKLDTSGAFNWRTNYSSGNIRDIFLEMALDTLGRIYVGGRSSIPGNVSEYDAKALRYDMNGVQEWLFTFDGGYNDLGTVLSPLNNDDVIIGITSNKIGFDENIQIIRLDNNGNNAWSVVHEGDAYANDTGSELTLDHDQNQIIIGSTNGFQASDLEDYAIVKMDTLGNQLWEYIYKHAEGGKDIAVAATTDSSNNIYVTGYTEELTGGGDFNMTTIKLSPNGNLLWTRTYAASAGGDDKPCAIEVDLQGNILVAGSGVENSTFDFLLIKYDPNGNLLSNHSFNHPGYGLADFAYDLAIDSSNNYYLTGSTQIASGSNVDFYIIKTNSAGSVLWEDTKGYYGGNSDIARKVIVTDSGYVYVAGSTVLLKYDENGTELWENNDPTIGMIVDMDVDSSENVLITANRAQPFGTDIDILKVSNAGVQSWIYTYNHDAGSEDTPYAIACAPNGEVFVVGKQEHIYNTNFQAVLLRLDSSGNFLSEKVYESTTHWEDKFTDVEILPSGRVLVAGQAYEEDFTNLPSITWRFNLMAASFGDTTAILKITEVNTANNEITIKNFGQGAIDISSHKLITDNNQANVISSLTVTQGTLWLPPSAEVTITGLALSANGEGLALYAPAPNFSNPNDLIDFVQWKTQGSSLESTAVGEGKWMSGTFVSGDSPYIYFGSATDVGSSFWNGFEAVISNLNQALCQTVCNGTATVSTSGAYPPYTYNWGTNAGNQTTATATTLCVDTFTVTVTDVEGNITSAEAIINPATMLTFNPMISVESCQGQDGQIVLIPSGGNGPYTYNWSNGDTDSLAGNLQNGSYTVTVTDNSTCQWDTIISITQDLGPQIQSFSVDSVTCYAGCDGAANVTAQGNGALSYIWNDVGASDSSSVSNLCSGYYSVLVTDPAGCSAIDSVMIGAPDSIVISVNTGPDSGQCDGTASAMVSGGLQPYTFLWDDPMNQTADSISNLCHGNYTVVVTDANGCSASVQTTIDNISFIEESQQNALVIYPNPAQSMLHIKSEFSGKMSWTITEASGKELLHGQASIHSLYINISDLAKGYYFFNVIRDGSIVSRAFIKN